MSKLKYLVLFAVLISSFSCKKKVEKKQIAVDTKRPNVLIIYPDQLRRYSAGFWAEDTYRKYVVGKPDPVLTPNIDRLAKDGAVFTQGISNYPLCSPARGMMLSGMYPEQNGIWNNCRAERKESLRDDIATVTDLFYQAGYNTSYFGKCHWLKNDPLFNEIGEYIGTTEAPGGHYINRYDTYVPPGKSRHSIEYFYQAIKDVHFDPIIYSNIPRTIEGKKDGVMHRPKIFSPKNESQKILQYLRNEHGERDESKPFCMVWSINPPHNPWDDENTDMEMLKKHYDTDKYPKVDRSLVVRDNADLEVAHYARHYFANVTSADYYVGVVLDELEKMGALDNTIVVFSSDHGETLGSHGKSGKNIMEMEAMAIPFIVHWPKGIKANTIHETLFGVPDVLPTVMGLAGLEKDIPKTVQGIDFSKEITNGNRATKQKQEALLLMLIHTRGILTNRYTLSVEETDDGTTINNSFIYDNQEDPYQLTRIPLEEKPEVAKELLKTLAKKLKTANDPWYQQKKFSDLIPYN